MKNKKHICPDCKSKEVEKLTNNPYGTDRYKCKLCNTEWDELTR